MCTIWEMAEVIRAEEQRKVASRSAGIRDAEAAADRSAPEPIGAERRRFEAVPQPAPAAAAARRRRA